MTPEQFDVIRDHLESCIEGASDALAAFAGIRDTPGLEYVRNQKLYWKHVIAGLTWALETARQQVRPHDVQQGTSLQ